MPNANDALTRVEQRLAEVEAMQQTVQTVRDELSRYQALLGRKLDWIHQSAAAPAESPSSTNIPVVGLPPPANEVEPEAAAEQVDEEADAEVYEQKEEEGEPGSERRTTARRRGNPIQLRITRLDNGDLLEGWVVDRSSGGIRLLLDQALPIKANLSVRPVKAQSNFPWIKAEVRSCKPERGGFSIGCMFLQKLTWGELQAFG